MNHLLAFQNWWVWVIISLGEKIIEQMKQVKEERKYLENIREELLKKVEKLFEQNKSKRYHGKFIKQIL